MIKAIGFDLDDTLYDRNHIYQQVFEEMKKYIQHKICFEEFNPVYQDYSKKYYQAFINGNCSQEHYQLQRTIDAFDTFECKIDRPAAQRFLDLYNHYKSKLSLRPGLSPLLESLQAQGFDLFVLTNGASSGQWPKIQELQLENYFSKKRIFVSEELNCSKPDNEIFQKVTERLGYQAEEILYIGDDWANDIEASLNNQWYALYLNVHQHPAPYQDAKLKIVENAEYLSDSLQTFLEETKTTVQF